MLLSFSDVGLDCSVFDWLLTLLVCGGDEEVDAATVSTNTMNARRCVDLVLHRLRGWGEEEQVREAEGKILMSAKGR